MRRGHWLRRRVRQGRRAHMQRRDRPHDSGALASKLHGTWVLEVADVHESDMATARTDDQRGAVAKKVDRRDALLEKVFGLGRARLESGWRTRERRRVTTDEIVHDLINGSMLLLGVKTTCANTHHTKVQAQTCLNNLVRTFTANTSPVVVPQYKYSSQRSSTAEMMLRRKCPSWQSVGRIFSGKGEKATCQKGQAKQTLRFGRSISHTRKLASPAVMKKRSFV